jgi:hypothetical protein
MRRLSARDAWFVAGLDWALVLTLIIANIEPLRSASGLWHPCVAPYDGSVGREGWSPLLIALAALPVVLGLVTAQFAPSGTAKRLARWGAIVLAVLVAWFVIVPTGTCVA